VCFPLSESILLRSAYFGEKFEAQKDAFSAPPNLSVELDLRRPLRGRKGEGIGWYRRGR